MLTCCRWTLDAYITSISFSKRILNIGRCLPCCGKGSLVRWKFQADAFGGPCWRYLIKGLKHNDKNRPWNKASFFDLLQYTVADYQTIWELHVRMPVKPDRAQVLENWVEILNYYSGYLP